MVRVTRIASSTMRLATRWTTSRSFSSASASASTAKAPTGVRSSWLMLATKSVRTASTRRRSLTSSITATAPPPSSGAAVTTIALRGGPYSSRFWRDDSPARARSSSRSTVSSTSNPMCVPAKASAARLRWWMRPLGPATTTPMLSWSMTSDHRGPCVAGAAGEPARVPGRRATTHATAAPAMALTTAMITVSTGRAPRQSRSLAAARWAKRAAPSCSGIHPVTRNRTRSPMFTAWSPMRS